MVQDLDRGRMTSFTSNMNYAFFQVYTYLFIPFRINKTCTHSIPFKRKHVHIKQNIIGAGTWCYNALFYI